MSSKIHRLHIHICISHINPQLIIFFLLQSFKLRCCLPLVVNSKRVQDKRQNQQSTFGEKHDTDKSLNTLRSLKRKIRKTSLLIRKSYQNDSHKH